MKLERFLFTAAWLYSSALCDGRVHANIHERRDLSAVLDHLQGSFGGENAALASQIEAGLGQAGNVPPGGATTIILGGPGGNPLGAISTTNQGAIWVTTSAPGPEASESVSSASSATSSAASSATQPAAQEPTTTLRGTATLTTTVTQAPAQSQAPPQTNSPSTGAPLTGTGSLPPILQKPSAAPATGGTLPPNLQQPATGGFVPPILQPSSIPPGVFPTPLPTGASPPSPVRPGTLATGTGTIVNDQCQCQCLCPVGSFPSPNSPAAPAVPGPPFPISNTTLQTVILPPTTSAALPSTILVDTSAPPVPTPTQPSTSPSPPAQSTIPTPLPVVTSLPQGSPTTTIPIVPPAQSVVESTSPTSTTDLSQTPTDLPPAPTPQPDQAGPADASGINISTFSLVSSLVLDLGG